MQWENELERGDGEFVNRWQQDLRLTQPAGPAKNLEKSVLKARERRLTRLAFAVLLLSGFVTGVVLTLGIVWLGDLPEGSLFRGSELVQELTRSQAESGGQVSLVWSSLLWFSVLFSVASGITGLTVAGIWQRLAHRREG